MIDDDDPLLSSKKSARERQSSEYDVGYGKPPVNTRFKPGQSGNAKGRPRKGYIERWEDSNAGILDIVTKIINEPLIVSRNGKKRSVRFIEGFIRQLAAAGLKDQGLAKVFLNLASAAEKANPPVPLYDLGKLTEEELIDFRRLHMRALVKLPEK